MSSQISTFCKHTTFILKDYPCHVVYENNEKYMKIFMHYNPKSICPFDVLDEIETKRLEFGLDELGWSQFYVCKRWLENPIDGFIKEFEFVSFYFPIQK